MNQFTFEKLCLEDAYVIENFYVGDNRGSFRKQFEKHIFEDAGISFQLSETFSSSSSKNVIRGMHFQRHNPQAKLVSVIHGKVWDVIVDLRPNSMTYKKWTSIELSAENHKSIFVPRGFAHGFASMEDDTVMLYQCDGAYDKESDTGIVYNDPDINICWPISEDIATHSARDLSLPSFKEYMEKPIEIK